jgi:hypothetical protein
MKSIQKRLDEQHKAAERLHHMMVLRTPTPAALAPAWHTDYAAIEARFEAALSGPCSLEHQLELMTELNNFYHKVIREMRPRE